MPVLLIDNHDSFSAILHHYLWELTGVRPLFYRNDALTREELKSLRFDAAVLSPGPGHPSNSRDFGICRDLLELYPDLPVLGVCLGHQGLADFAGGKVVPLAGARHGRPSPIRHDGEYLFRGLPQGFHAVRYHSLVVEPESLPANVRATAWSGEDNQLMGLRFTDRPWFGVQFHPESIGTEYGKALLKNFLEIAKSEIVREETARADESVSTHSREAVRHLELTWKDPEEVFASHFSQAPIAFWLDGGPADSKVGWPAICMGRAESTCEFRELTSIREWHDGLVLGVQKSAPWSGYRGGPVGHLTYESQGRWMLPEGYLVFDRRMRKVFAAWEDEKPPEWLQALIEGWLRREDAAERATAFLPPFQEWRPVFSEEAYKQRVERIQEFIAKGDTYEACLTHAFTVKSDADPSAVFPGLRARNPAPYAAYLAFPGSKLLSVSPELFLELSSAGFLRSRPMKGTRPRGGTRDEDARLKEDLARHPKDGAENRMIVDLTRHDFSRVCALGSVEVPSFLEVETHPAVFQLVSEVRGRLESDRHPLDAVESCFPGGSMTGAPKERTMELLSVLEAGPRGAFSGALGYFTRDNSFNLSMVIRTLENRGDSWRVGCGGAVLADSDPEAEWREATLKARSVIDAAAERK